jgi:hypothetical protein
MRPHIGPFNLIGYGSNHILLNGPRYLPNLVTSIHLFLKAIHALPRETNLSEMVNSLCPFALSSHPIHLNTSEPHRLLFIVKRQPTAFPK